MKLRNQAARKLGFANYHVMQLALSEQSQQEVLALFDQLDTLTRQPFRAAKAELDAAWRALRHRRRRASPLALSRPVLPGAARGGRRPVRRGLRPLDIPGCAAIFTRASACRSTTCWPQRSLRAERESSARLLHRHRSRGRRPRAGQHRAQREWLGTLLHELGHSVYSSKNIPRSVPYVLRCESHILTTEGVAMMFGRFADNADWLKAMGVKVPDPEQFRRTAAERRRNQLLVFSRWCQVMFRFEMALYDNPDQDLNRLWWDLVEKYQEIRRPEGRDEPDYAAKIHIVSSAGLLPQLPAGRVVRLAGASCHRPRRAPRGRADHGGLRGQQGGGRFHERAGVRPGCTLDWHELTRFATGEDLNAKAFAEDIRSE